MKTPEDMVSGLRHVMKGGNALHVLNYQGVKSVLCQFEDTGTIVNTSSYSIRVKSVKDRNRRSVFNVGYLGYGKYNSSINGRKTPQYNRWKGMLARCYSERHQENNPSYKGCSVCSEWHNFQNFANWYDDNIVEGYDLDKDILINGNRIYSPSTCIFASSYDNKEKANSKMFRLTDPNGNNIEVYNLSKFCKNNNLITSSMRCLFDGRMKSHKGWVKTK